MSDLPSLGLNLAQQGSVIWITGLSDSGKTTLARLVAANLRAQGLQITLLDGDELRRVLGATTEYDRDSRLSLGFKAARLCQLLASQGHTVVIAIIGLFREIHEWNRQQPYHYYEVFLDVPLEELRRRDSKGLYRRFDAGEMTQVYGLDLAYDPPACPEWRVQFKPNQANDPPQRIADRLCEDFLQRYAR